DRFDVPSSHAADVESRRDLSEAGREQSLSATTHVRTAEIHVMQQRGAADDESVARALARAWDLPFLSPQGLAVDRAAAATLGPEQSAPLRAVPVRSEEGALRVAIDAPSAELFARVGEHHPDGAAFAVVTPATLDRLLLPRFSQPSRSVGVADSTAADGTGLGVILSLLEDETSRISSI